MDLWLRHTDVADAPQGSLQGPTRLRDLFDAIPGIGANLTKLFALDSDDLNAQTIFSVRPQTLKLGHSQGWPATGPRSVIKCCVVTPVPRIPTNRSTLVLSQRAPA